MGRIERSWRMFKQSQAVLMKDKELMILPLISSLMILIVLLSFVFGFQFTNLEALDQDETRLGLISFAFYVITYTIGIFFQGAVIAGASQRLAGGDPTVGSSIGAAARRLPAFLAWGLIAATVGLAIRNLQERSEVIGKFLLGLLGMVWSLAVFFVVPVIVMEDKSVPGSISRSWSLFKKTWGETVIGNMGLGLLGFLLSIPILVIVALLILAHLVIPAIVIGVLAVGVLSMYLSALQGVWVASLYRYATSDEIPDGFDPELVRAAFRPRHA